MTQVAEMLTEEEGLMLEAGVGEWLQQQAAGQNMTHCSRSLELQLI